MLDLGAGRGQSSDLIAREFGTRVLSVDFWIGLGDHRSRHPNVTPLQGDIRRSLPLPQQGLDAVICLQAFHTMGGSPMVLRYLHAQLKPGGTLALAQTCFDREHDPLPPVLAESHGWRTDYDRYHTPGWWARHVTGNANFASVLCRESPDGDILWKDHAAYLGDTAGWSKRFCADHAWRLDHILSSRPGGLRLTHLEAVFTSNHA